MSDRRKMASKFAACVFDAYGEHVVSLKQASEAKRQATTLSNIATDKEVVRVSNVWDTLGKKQPSDRFDGCVNLRTLRTLLKIIDDRGFERCACHFSTFPTFFHLSTYHLLLSLAQIGAPDAIPFRV